MTEAKITDYDAWAQQYDNTRSVSPSVLEPLLKALGPSAGRSLIDIGGGTGNYNAALTGAGFRVLHCDPSPGMVQRAASKPEIEMALVADGQALPFGAGTFDCAIAIKVLNHVPDRPAFITEARRIMRTGPLVLLHATKEGITANWVSRYFPSLLDQQRFEPEDATVDMLRAVGFGETEVSHIRYEDAADGSAQALKRVPEAFLTDELIMNTSLLSRLPDDARREGLEAIRRDYRSGRLAEVIAEYETLSERYGDGSLFVARP